MCILFGFKLHCTKLTLYYCSDRVILPTTRTLQLYDVAPPRLYSVVWLRENQLDCSHRLSKEEEDHLKLFLRGWGKLFQIDPRKFEADIASFQVSITCLSHFSIMIFIVVINNYKIL
jgi:hypothetical protein